MKNTGNLNLRLLASLILITALFLSACDNGTQATPTTAADGQTPTAGMVGQTPVGGGTMGTVNYPGGSATLNGAGATFPLPLVSRWAQDYKSSYPGVKINYQGIGSGGGKKQITAKTVDFAGSDSPLDDKQLEAVGGSDALLHIPWTMGAVVLGYNLPGLTPQMRLDGPAIAGIYLGKITKWNDPALKALNPGLDLPDKAIAVVHRSEGSGTTDIFTDYLSKVSDEWKSKVGRSTSVQWPVGIGAQGNDGVANQINLTQGSIGYLEASYAKSNNILYAYVKNKAGNFVDATAENVSAAADGAVQAGLPADLRYSITDAKGEKAYPIAGTSWVLVYVNQSEAEKGKVLAYFIWWATHEGQQYAQALNYAPLPQSLVERDEAQIKKMQCGGSPCLP